MTITIEDVSAVYSSGAPATATVSATPGGEASYMAVMAFGRDTANVPSSVEPFTTATFDGNALTAQTAADNPDGAQEQLSRAFTWEGSLTTGNKDGVLAWTGGFSGFGYLLLASSDTNTLEVVDADIIQHANWNGSSISGTITGLEEGDLVVFFGGVNGGASIISDATGNLTMSSDTPASVSCTYMMGRIVLGAGETDFDWDFTHASGSQRSSIGYLVIREAAASGISQTIGQASEADTALPIVPFESETFVAIGQASEADTALPITIGAGPLTVAIGIASEADTALVITPFEADINVAIGIASEVDTAISIAPVSVAGGVALGQASEIDTALPIVPTPGDLSIPIGISAEADTALPIVPSESPDAVAAVGIASEADTALPIVPTFDNVNLAISIAVEVDTALSITPLVGGPIVPIGIATETDIALPITVEGGEASAPRLGDPGYTEYKQQFVEPFDFGYFRTKYLNEQARLERTIEFIADEDHPPAELYVTGIDDVDEDIDILEAQIEKLETQLKAASFQITTQETLDVLKDEIKEIESVKLAAESALLVLQNQQAAVLAAIQLLGL